MSKNINNRINEFRKLSVATVIGTTLTMMSMASMANTVIDNQSISGSPTMISGELGAVNQSSPVLSLKKILISQPAYGVAGNEDFQVISEWTDALGMSHTRFEQTINGIRVYGTSMVMHTDKASGGNSLLATDTVYAISGTLAVNSLPQMTSLITNGNDKGMQAYKIASSIGSVKGSPELAYVYLPETGNTKLAWKIDVKYDTEQGFEYDEIFFDVSTAQEIERHPNVYRAKSLETYDLENKGPQSGFAPGRLICSTGQSCSDSSAQRAHTSAGQVYDYYKDTHGRDSINDKGMTIISSVHTQEKLNNAFYFRQQMFYGDGDGIFLDDLTKSFDVIAHELTHGVIEFTADLVYRNESGALNEAMADIMAISAKVDQLGGNPDWKIGAEIMIGGGALRFMDNPTKDNQSRDFYPERFTESGDNGGVHLNSGIVNLAFVLLVEGGTHPRNKTNIEVDGIGIEKSEKIFYRALTTYFNAGTNFSAAKSGTEQAAEDLFGEDVKQQVSLAWCAVGVGTCGDGNDGDDNKGSNELQNGVVVSNINISKGGDKIFTMQVPQGAVNINFEISGGSGDADLYVRQGSATTDSAFDCRPFKTGNSESCAVSSTGKYFVRVNAYESVSGLSLTGSFNK